ncbi:T9SS type A sorting domain-containing protein, partial [Crocinitomicaceae bacterium]|nr:T9SS type A sorting domain-containing protein [Crocinitomicaceae bacterium]
PVEVGVFDDWYVHDGYVENDTMYLGHINDGFFSIVDVQTPSSPVLLGTQQTPSNFSHNIWTSGGQYAYTTDEVSNGYIGAYDISDPLNIIELDRIQSSPGANVVPHNTHVLGNYIITSYYSDGVTVHDVTHPYNMVEVANYDTYPIQTEGYDGCWGAYPYLPSGLILATDREYGLFVLNPNYQQAAYLEGLITNSVSSVPVDLVDVQILGHNQQDVSNSSGMYATGIAAAGVYDVTYSKIGYYSQTIQVTLTNGVVSVQDLQLVPIPPFNLQVTVFEDGTNNPIDGADILLDGLLLDDFGVTNALGEETFVLYYQELYRFSVGKWGYLTHCESVVIDTATGSLSVFLIPGIYDDFTFDNGWTSSGSATTGLFERGVPNGTSLLTNPNVDSENDCNDFCYVTGNADTDDFNADDVDAGDAELRSPIIDLTGYLDPYVSYERWYYCDYGVLPPGDSLEVFVSNGLTAVRIDVQTYDQSANSKWMKKTIRILDHIDLTSTMQFNFKIADFMPDVNITEAGVDHFFIVESDFVETVSITPLEVRVYPNPSESLMNIDGLTNATDFDLIAISGRIVKQGWVSPNDNTIAVTSIQNGVYFLRIGKQMQKIVISH